MSRKNIRQSYHGRLARAVPFVQSTARARRPCYAPPTPLPSPRSPSRQPPNACPAPPSTAPGLRLARPPAPPPPPPSHRRTSAPDPPPCRRAEPPPPYVRSAAPRTP